MTDQEIDQLDKSSLRIKVAELLGRTAVDAETDPDWTEDLNGAWWAIVASFGVSWSVQTMLRGVPCSHAVCNNPDPGMSVTKAYASTGPEDDVAATICRAFVKAKLADDRAWA